MIGRITVVFVATTLLILTSFELFLRQPPDLYRLSNTSAVLRSENGAILELRLTEDGYWREAVSIDEVDPKFVEMLIAYEDERFFQHSGVDAVAFLRAISQLLKEGRIVSGASTITMQLARLLDRRLARRGLLTKLKQMLFALRLERHLTKEEILLAYLSVAPYGGNLEGVKAASVAWFQRGPEELTLSEAALLVALPQSPEGRRPDRNPARAIEAKNRVILRLSERFGWGKNKTQELLSEGLPIKRYRPQSLAPHLFDRLLDSRDKPHLTTIINTTYQAELKRLLRRAVEYLPDPINAAGMVVETKTGKVRAYVGSIDYLNEKRKGANNYLQSKRSPGSTLKPLIYAEAISRNLISIDHVFNDQLFSSEGYAPTNFDQTYRGKISLKAALQWSRNIPAIKALQMIGADNFEARLSTFSGTHSGAKGKAGLTLAIGGYYLTPEVLAQFYSALATDGRVRKLRFTPDDEYQELGTMVSERGASAVRSLLSQRHANGSRIIAKTGTSHNRQDAWTALLTENHVIIIWLGTPDQQATNVLLGGGVAMPIAVQFAQNLGLRTPSIEPLETFRSLAQSDNTSLQCEKLITIPEDGEWIISDDLYVAVHSRFLNVAWYVNGESYRVHDNVIKFDEKGFHKISAERGGCREIVSVAIN